MKDSHAILARAATALSAALLFALLLYLAAGPAAPEEASPTAAQAEPLALFRTDREVLRRQEMAQLHEILEDEGTSSALRAQAQQRLMDLLRWADEEATVEEVLAARGFEMAVVSVHADSCNVAVRAPEGLTQQQAAVILELVSRETGLTGGTIKVIPIK